MDSQSDSKMEFDYEPVSATDSISVADFYFATSSDSTTEERFLPAILQLLVDSSRQCDQLWCNIYMNTIIVGNPSSNVRIPHNCNTR